MAVEKPLNTNERYGATQIVDKEGVSKYRFVDDIIDIVICATPEQFLFELKNVSKTSIKVIWNEATIVNHEGISSKVVHEGTKLSKIEEDQLPTTIIKSAKIIDVACPASNIKKGCITDSMYPVLPELQGELRLVLPIQIENTVNEYIFIFDVNYIYLRPELLNVENL